MCALPSATSVCNNNTIIIRIIIIGLIILQRNHGIWLPAILPAFSSARFPASGSSPFAVSLSRGIKLTFRLKSISHFLVLYIARELNVTKVLWFSS